MQGIKFILLLAAAGSVCASLHVAIPTVVVMGIAAATKPKPSAK